jgi:hypothetical protein
MFLFPKSRNSICSLLFKKRVQADEAGLRRLGQADGSDFNKMDQQMEPDYCVKQYKIGTVLLMGPHNDFKLQFTFSNGSLKSGNIYKDHATSLLTTDLKVSYK